MIRLALDRGNSDGLTVLCLGAHSDDIEIGCGGTILRLAEQYPGVSFHWAVFSAAGIREAEARKAASLFAGTALRQILLKTFPDGFLPFEGAQVKRVFEELKQAVSPDLILTPCRKDAHQDHRTIAELTWNTFRNHLIWEYEIPKYDGDLGQPNVFVPLEAEMCRAKVRHLIDAFQSQHSKRWFEESTFLSLLRLRGMECNAASGYAEAFYCRKLTV
ncbi:MAG TPA: PIG-L deacetylase family protein [Candidatus Eisenbacteria bacterium]|nr:PIG-L deacetylase family protein [Candidatus Eisenbacteria bacterium]